MKVYVLGAGGWIPSINETSCLMIEYNNSLFILDAGTGIVNIKKYQNILSKYNTIHLLLSHYHLDHLIGIIYLEPFIRNKNIKIYGPGKLAYPNTTDFYIRSLLRNEFFSKSIDDFSNNVQIKDFPNEKFFIDKTEIRVAEQEHSATSFQISVDNKLIYATDTIFNPNSWKNIYSDVLFHECWNYKIDSKDSHTSLYQLKNQIPLQNFNKIFLIHQNPDWTKDDYRKIEEIIFNTNLFLAKDGMEINV